MYLFIILLINIVQLIDITAPSTKSSYDAEPLISYETLKRRPRRFKKFTLFTLDVFDNIVLTHMADYVELPRNFYQLNGNVYENTIEFNELTTRRGTVLSTEDRIIRFICMLRGVKSYIIEEIFDQDYSVALRDFKHCSLACINGLGPLYLTMLEPGSDECNRLTGHNAFGYFRNAMYAADVTKVGDVRYVTQISKTFLTISLFYLWHSSINDSLLLSSITITITIYDYNYNYNYNYNHNYNYNYNCNHNYNYNYRFQFNDQVILQSNQIIMMVTTSNTMLDLLHFATVWGSHDLYMDTYQENQTILVYGITVIFDEKKINILQIIKYYLIQFFDM